MRIVSFDAFRSLHIPGARYIKAEHYLDYLPLLEQADWLLFPEYWQVNSLYYGLGARLFPSIASYHLGHNKIEMSRALQMLCPQNIPHTEIHANTAHAQETIWARFNLPFVAKNIRSSEGRGVYLINELHDWRRYCANHDVLYIQEYLPIDRDLRLVVIGQQVIAGYWRLQGSDGFHNNLAAGGHMDFSPAPGAALALVKHVASALQIDHAGFDIAWYEGQAYILEFNRLFGNRGLIEQGVRPAEWIYAYLAAQQAPPRTPPHNRPFAAAQT